MNADAATDLTIATIWRYPVKSMLGEQLTSASVDANGIIGDRGWCLFDPSSSKALTARREPALLFGSAQVTNDGAGSDEPLRVALTLPSGLTVEGTGLQGADDPATNSALSEWIGRPVELRRASPDAVGTYETQADETETGDWIEWQGPEGSFHDSTRTRISLVSKTTMRDWDERRFRINVILDGDGEDELPGSMITLGSSVLNVTKQIDRCVVTTREQPGAVARDLSVLKAINKERDGFLGIGCLVDQAGTLSIGDVASIG